MGVARVLLIVIAAVLTLLGTYLFALFPSFPPLVGSGLGFAMNLPMIIGLDPGADAVVFYLLLVLFIVWLASGALQLVGLKSKIVGIIFSLVPLAIGLMFVLLVYTEILGAMSATFFLMTSGEVIGGVIPILIEIGGMGLGVYFLLAGGVLGVVGSSLSKD
ncbi:MAG: hypothetical protein KGD74_04230 [Candidatus Lokiarchaeota archaeon]|nr:hypothetical protein [Candidatus Lokiarchaeota archaeon]